MTSNDKTTPYIPLSGLAEDGFSKADTATATCYCGAVQLEFVSTTFQMIIKAGGLNSELLIISLNFKSVYPLTSLPPAN